MSKSGHISVFECFCRSTTPVSCSSADGASGFLATRNAERTFFDVIGGAGTAAVHSCAAAAKKKYKKVADSPSDDVSNAASTSYESSIKVVSEILGDLEEEASAAATQLSTAAARRSPQNPLRDATARTSLVVDVHIPPDPKLLSSSAAGDSFAAAAAPVATSAGTKLCKHEVNRFQTRCYSDGQQSSPKWKGKV